MLRAEPRAAPVSSFLAMMTQGRWKRSTTLLATMPTMLPGQLKPLRTRQRISVMSMLRDLRHRLVGDTRLDLLALVVQLVQFAGQTLRLVLVLRHQQIERDTASLPPGSPH